MNTSKDLCSNCGMCCDGTLFPFFRIKPEESHLFSDKTGVINIPQKCMHFNGCDGCKIYENRPNTCSSYKCPVLRSFEKDKISFEDSLKYIKSIKEDKNNKEKRSAFITGKILK
tara:strand:- start:573 stop:914 length:342 start_codon:yes stop_codon:yes gene_type:complete